MPRADGLGRVPAVEVMIAHAVHPRLHRRQGPDQPDPRRDCRRHVAVRDADVRPVDLQPLSAGVRDARRSAALGVEHRRVQAQGPGHLDHRGAWRATRWPSRAASSQTSSGLAADTGRSAYLDALHLLSRRALSVAECRDRLLARDHLRSRYRRRHRSPARDRRPRRPAAGAARMRAPRSKSRAADACASCASCRRGASTRTWPRRPSRRSSARRTSGRSSNTRAAEEAARALEAAPMPPNTRGSIST